MSKSKSRLHKQKLYKMKGCSYTRKNKKYLGGKNPYLAYTPNSGPKVTNPFLAYTGKGGQLILNGTISNTGQMGSGTGNVYPAMAPPGLKGDYFINSQVMRGGNCSVCNLQKGGTCSTCFPDLPIVIQGGAQKHRKGCKCSICKKNMRGGAACSNNGIPYPNGLVGSGWTINNLPGTGLPGGSNHYKFNPQIDNPQTQIKNVGANPPFSIGGRGKTRKNLKGGALNNLMFQDVVNLGRQFSYGLGSAYNTLAGYPAPVNPLPWKGQLVNQTRFQMNK
jgi:hypothetical protein